MTGAAGPVSRVELRVECKDLKKKDEFSKSDPCAALYVLSRKSQKWEEVSNVFFYCACVTRLILLLLGYYFLS